MNHDEAWSAAHFQILVFRYCAPCERCALLHRQKTIILTTKQLTHEENLYSRIAAGSFPCCRSTKPRYHELRRQGRILCNVRERRKDGETAIETDTLVYDGAANSFTLPQITYGDMVFS